MPKHGNLDLEKLIKAKMDNFEIRNLDLPCVTNCHTWFGRGERQLQVVTWGKSFKEPRLVLPVLELVLMKRGDVMIVQ